ncbi:MAG: pimB 4 [Frankiales bacterium]|nr:pimB 4 [Frankiales bacterium]
MAVYAPADGVGGVEQVASAAYQALSASPCGAQLHLGPRRIVASRRPPSTWMSLTWKTHALVTATHPRLPGPSVLWLHGAELTRDRSRAHQLLRSRALHTSDVLLAVSPMAAQLLPPDVRRRVQLVGPPIRAGALPLGQGQERDSGELRLVSVGRAIPRKGHDTAIEVASLLATQRDVRLDVVGPGPDLPRLRQLAATKEHRKLRIAVHGAVAEHERDRLYASAEALLFLPRHEEGEYEGLGLVVLEAAAFGCPAVVLDCGGSRFGIAQGETGILLAATAGSEAIAAAVVELAGYPGAAAAARRYASRFALPDWQARVRAIAAGHLPAWTWPDTSRDLTREST